MRCEGLAPTTTFATAVHITISFLNNTTKLITMPAKAKTAAKPSGPSYFDLIKDAIVSLAERNGSSRQAIKKYVSAKKKDMKNHVLNKALSSGVAANKLVQVKGSYKLPTSKGKKVWPRDNATALHAISQDDGIYFFFD